MWNELFLDYLLIWIIYWYWIVSVKVTICNLLRPYIWQQGIQDSDCAPCGWWSNSGWWCSRNGTTSKAETSVVYLYYFVQIQLESVVKEMQETMYTVLFLPMQCFFFAPLYLQTVSPMQSWIHPDTVINRYSSTCSWDRIIIVLNLSNH